MYRYSSFNELRKCNYYISNVIKVDRDVNAGESYEFNTQLSRTGNEPTIVVKSIAAEGSCAKWLTYDKTPFNISTPVQKHIQFTVPKDATNGIATCVIKFTADSLGNTETELGLPFKLNISGGSSPQQASVVSTPTQVIQIATPAPTPVKNLNISATPEVPKYDALTFVIIGAGLLVTLIIGFVLLRFKKDDVEVINLT